MQSLFIRSNTGPAGDCATTENKMTTQNAWAVSNVENATYIGMLEIEGGGYFEILATKDRVVFGSACNAGFLESGYIMREPHESLDDTLQELHADLSTYYSDGAQYVSRIVCNERM
jgi:hypothetical protein